MSSERRSPVISRPLGAIALLALLAALVAPSAARAKPEGGPQAGQPHVQHAAGQPAGQPAVTQSQGTASASGGAGGQATGSVADDTQTLGGESPDCQHPHSLDAQAQTDCRLSGTPQSPFPVGNYAPDQHIDTGITDISNDFDSALQSMLGAIFGLIERIVAAAMLAVSLAFGFDLYASDTHGKIPAALHSAEQFFTAPLLSAALVIAGFWMVLKLIAHRQEGRAIAGIAAMSVMMIASLVVINDPQATIGPIDTAANQAAMASIGAFSGNQPSLTDAESSYADATRSMWQEMGEKPWCAEEFGSVDWCTGPIDPTMQKAQQSVEAALRAYKNNDGSGQAEPRSEQDAELARVQQAKTNGELFLAFPADDDARNGQNDTWTLYHYLLGDQPALAAIRGSGGVGNRLGTLVFGAIGMSFFLLLLAYIALNLLIASLLLVVLLLFLGLMALFPAFGDWGRERWLQWAGMTLAALGLKLLYAIYLGILLGASALVGAIGSGEGGWFAQWLLFSAFWMIAFAFRSKLTGLIAPAGGHHEHHRGLEAAVAALPAVALTRAAARNARAIGRGAYDHHRDAREERKWQRDYERVEAGHRLEIETQVARGQDAEHRLDERARAMLDAHYQAAQDTLTEAPEIETLAAMARAEGERLRTYRLAQDERHPLGAEEREAFTRATELDGTLLAARRFLADAQEHERQTGQRYTTQQRRDARAALEHELGSHPDQRDYRQLAYRLGGDGRRRWDQASEPERALMRERIDKQFEQDREANAAAKQAPRQLEPPKPVMPPAPKRRRPHRYRRYGEPLGARHHMPPLSRRPE